MGQWVVTVAGIAILSVLCDIILPEGQTRKYVKTVFGVVVTLVIVQPLISIFGGGISFSDARPPTELQEQFLDNATDRQEREKAASIASVLEANGVEVESVAISDGNVTVILSTGRSVETEAKIRMIARTYCPDCTVEIIWV